jgi:hypothetical protein
MDFGDDLQEIQGKSKAPNHEIWGKIRLHSSISNYMKTKQLILYGVVQRMEDNRWPKKCWSGCHQGRQDEDGDKDR